MTWIKIDDRMPWHPKMAELSDSAVALWLRGLCYSSMHLTDGKVTSAAIHILRDPLADYEEDPEKELVRKGIWVEVEGGWEVVNYLQHQRSRAEIEGERASNTKRVTEHRMKRKCNALHNRNTADVKRKCNGPIETETESETETERVARAGDTNKAQTATAIPAEIQAAAFSVFGSEPATTLMEWVSLYDQKIILAALAETERQPKEKRRPSYTAAILQRWVREGRPDQKALMKVEIADKARRNRVKCPRCNREKVWSPGQSMECYSCGSRYVEVQEGVA